MAADAQSGRGLRENESFGPYADRIGARLARWTAERASERIWKKDPTFWPEAAPSDVETRLGWLTLPTAMASQAESLRRFAKEVRDEGFEHALVLGMGGSSLAPEVFARTLGPAPGFPDLSVLDSTHPLAVSSRVRREAIGHTLFIVSSKSGTTLEPNAFFRYAWSLAGGAPTQPGRHFVAITDPGTPLAGLAKERGLRRCFTATPDVGGRYSALTAFGIVPYAVLGRDPSTLLASALRMSEACGPWIPAESSPGLRLGAALGELALAGRNKVVFLTSPGLTAFPSWVEQLIAESLGKRGRGLIPVPHEARPTEPLGGKDAVLVRVQLRGEEDPATERGLDTASTNGVPVLRFELPSKDDLGQEIFRWEFAIASVGAVIGVNPFDQPDVELAKELAREAMKPSGPATMTPPPAPLAVGDSGFPGALGAWLASAHPADYIAVQAFLPPVEEVAEAVDRLASRLRDITHLATTAGFGPRFLHSTGQLHKGGPPTGLFLQLVDQPASDIEIPEMGISFGQVLKAQAAGDASALLQKGRRLLRVNVGSHVVEGVASVSRAVPG